MNGARQLDRGDRRLAVTHIDDRTPPIEQLRAARHHPRIERRQPPRPRARTDRPGLQGARTETDNDNEPLADGAAPLEGISFAFTQYVPSSCRPALSSRGMLAE